MNLKLLKNYQVSDLLNENFDCQCKKKHKVDIKDVIVENGAISKVPEVIRSYGFKNVYCVCDQNTYLAAGEKVEVVLNQAGIKNSIHVFNRENWLVPDEEAVGEFLIHMSKEVDGIIAIGAGVLNDLCKFMSYRQNIPYIVVATAPSMDGFASDGAALIIESLKTTLTTTMPKAIIGDVDILKNAPKEMIAAGFGDMIGKFSALNDWKISSIINGEYYCEVIVQMVRDGVQECINNIEGIKNREDMAIKRLMEGLVLTGIAMSFSGNSRPASGSEHHLAHFWEMMFLFDNREPVLHGIKVGINTLFTNRIREKLIHEKLNFEEIETQVFDYNNWLRDVKKIYKQAATGIVNLNEKEKLNSIEERNSRLKIIENNWEQLVNAIMDVPSTNEIEEMLLKVGAPVRPFEVGVDEYTVEKGVLYSKEVRARYTILQLLWDVGLLEKYSTELTKEFCK